MIYSNDGSLSYFIKRFDRYGKGKKHATEDFAQLTGNSRDTKYNYTMEKLVNVIEEYCTFPAIEKADFFKRILFCFITGNEDMHLKNFSVITKAGKTNLTPVYDFINSSISINNPQEELALSLKGKKSNFKATELIDYYAKERLELNNKTIDSILFDMNKCVSKWTELIEISFLSDKMKEKYLKLMNDRVSRF